MPAPIAPSSSYRAPAPAQFAAPTPGLAPWLRQGTAPLQAGGRVGEFLRTGFMPSSSTMPAFTPNAQPWYGDQLNQGMTSAAQAVAAKQQAAQALEAQKTQAEIIRNMEEMEFRRQESNENSD